MHIKKVLESGRKKVNQLHSVISNRDINVSARKMLLAFARTRFPHTLQTGLSSSLSIAFPSLVARRTKCSHALLLVFFLGTTNKPKIQAIKYRLSRLNWWAVPHVLTPS